MSKRYTYPTDEQLAEFNALLPPGVRQMMGVPAPSVQIPDSGDPEQDFMVALNAALNKGTVYEIPAEPEEPAVSPLYDPTQGMGQGYGQRPSPSRGPEAEFNDLLRQIADRPSMSGRPTRLHGFIR